MVGGGRPLLPEISSSTTASEKKVQLESVQLRKPCNEGRPTSCQSLSPLLTTPMRSLKSLGIRCRLIEFLLLILYVILWPWPLIPWTWRLTY